MPSYGGHKSTLLWGLAPQDNQRYPWFSGTDMLVDYGRTYARPQ